MHGLLASVARRLGSCDFCLSANYMRWYIPAADKTATRITSYITTPRTQAGVCPIARDGDRGRSAAVRFVTNTLESGQCSAETGR